MKCRRSPANRFEDPAHRSSFINAIECSLAVNIPEQEPQEGQAKRSSMVSSSSSIFPAENAPTPSKTETRSIAFPSGVRPAGIGPPETKMVGILTRIAAINMLGSIAFAISAVGAFVVPSSGELLSLPLVNIFTFIGALMFFVGAALLIPAMRPEPTQAAELTT